MFWRTSGGWGWIVEWAGGLELRKGMGFRSPRIGGTGSSGVWGLQGDLQASISSKGPVSAVLALHVEKVFLFPPVRRRQT